MTALVRTRRQRLRPQRSLQTLLAAVVVIWPAAAAAQDHAGAQMPPTMNMSSGWQFMSDGALFALANQQSGPRGGSDVVAPNWWMGMASKKVGRDRLTFNVMLSLDPLTVGGGGYHELFQVGEARNGLPLVDRQHPHDFFAQLAAVWRLPLTDTTGLTIAGGPAGEPALGPVAFMHRASAQDLPLAPLSHHTFDSTHISYGVVTAAVDHGPFVVEGSVFNGREPDEHRWNFDFGPLDSVSARIWYTPNDRWEFQASTGHLHHPEQLEPGDIERTTASASWMRHAANGVTAMTIGYGVNAAADATRQAVFGELRTERGRNTFFTRIETVQLETALILTERVPDASASALHNAVGAFTIGALRTWSPTRIDVSVGAEATVYASPAVFDQTHGAHPMSLQIFLRIRPLAGAMGRMLNMRMSQPMIGHTTMDMK